MQGAPKGSTGATERHTAYNDTAMSNAQTTLLQPSPHGAPRYYRLALTPLPVLRAF